MKELLEYQNKINTMSIEDLLNELEKQVDEKDYNRFCSNNGKLQDIAKNKIMLIKITILSKIK